MINILQIYLTIFYFCPLSLVHALWARGLGLCTKGRAFSPSPQSAVTARSAPPPRTAHPGTGQLCNRSSWKFCNCPSTPSPLAICSHPRGPETSCRVASGLQGATPPGTSPGDPFSGPGLCRLPTVLTQSSPSHTTGSTASYMSGLPCVCVLSPLPSPRVLCLWLHRLPHLHYHCAPKVTHLSLECQAHAQLPLGHPTECPQLLAAGSPSLHRGSSSFLLSPPVTEARILRVPVAFLSSVSCYARSPSGMDLTSEAPQLPPLSIPTAWSAFRLPSSLPERFQQLPNRPSCPTCACSLSPRGAFPKRNSLSGFQASGSSETKSRWCSVKPGCSLPPAHWSPLPTQPQTGEMREKRPIALFLCSHTWALRVPCGAQSPQTTRTDLRGRVKGVGMTEGSSPAFCPRARPSGPALLPTQWL